MNPDIIVEIKELEFGFEKQIKALEGIVFNNPSAVFFDLVLIKYDLETNSTKKLEVCKWNSKKKLRDLMRMLFKEKIFVKNLVRKENVYFAVTPKTKLLNFIWLDDLKRENLTEKQLKYITLIETSEGNYQGWIKLDKVYSENRIQQIKHYLVEKLKADKAATAKIQPMRLPGFYSYKREEPFFVKVYRVAEKTLNGKALLEKIQSLRATAIRKKKSVMINNSQKSNGNWQKYSYYKKQLGLKNANFDPLDERDYIIKYFNVPEKDIDKNIVDINYVYQLLIRDYSQNDIFLYLQQTRPDLDDKHKAGDYFERTYLKALLFKKLFFPKHTLFDNSRLLNFIKEQKENGNWDESKKVTENLRILISKIK